jgi:hypothetical protein
MASISGANTILLKFDEDGQFLEGPLAAAAMPGMNLVMTSAADTQLRDTYTPGATSAGGTRPATTPLFMLPRRVTCSRCWY